MQTFQGVDVKQANFNIRKYSKAVRQETLTYVYDHPNLIHPDPLVRKAFARAKDVVNGGGPKFVGAMCQIECTNNLLDAVGRWFGFPVKDSPEK